MQRVACRGDGVLRRTGTLRCCRTPAVMAKHNEHIENPKCSSRNGEEINPGYTVGMVFEKRPIDVTSLAAVGASHSQVTIDGATS